MKPGFKSQKEMLQALMDGKTLRHFRGGRTVTMNADGNVVCAKGTQTGLPATPSDWSILARKPKVLAYVRVHYSRHYVRNIGAVIYTVEGSEDHRDLECGKEYNRAPDLDPVTKE